MENVAFLTRKKLTMDKFSSQVKISTENPIKRILNVDVSSIISSCDCINGTISISGKIKVNLIFVNKLDGVEHSEVYYDFIEKQQQKFELSDIYALDNLTLKSVSFSGTESICVLEHNIKLDASYTYDIPMFSDENNEFVIQNSSFESQKFVSLAEDNFTVAEEAEVNILNANILSSTANVVITDVNCLVDKIAIEGKILSTIIYNDLDNIESYSREFEFKQEIQANDVLPNMIVSVSACIKNIAITLVENETKTNLTYSFDIYARGLVYEEYTYETIEDMFSLKNNLKTTYDYIEAKTYSKMKNLTDTVMLSEDISKLENFDDVAQVYLPRFFMKNIEESDTKAILTGQIISEVIYKTTDDLFSYETKLPVKLEIEKDLNEYVGDTNVSVDISSFKVKAGKFLEVLYNVNYTVHFDKLVSEKYVKSYEVLSEKNENSSGIKIYITKQGETLFEVAKSLNVRPATITSQNEVMQTFEQGEKIYIYSPVNLLN